MIEQAQADLVLEAATGQLSAFAQLYERYYGPLVALAYATLADRHLAEDAAQEAFAIACRDVGRLRQPDRIGPWLAGICRNVARRLARQRSRCRLTDRLPDQPAPANQHQHNGLVRQAVWDLPERLREVVLLRYFNDLSYEDIAAVLGLTTAAVHGRLTRARRKLAHTLKQQGYHGTNP